MAKITVVMPAYNAAKYIKEAIDSVLNQTFLDWELVIVDDCSTDSTYSIILQYELQDSRIRVYQMPQNSGSAFRQEKKLFLKPHLSGSQVLMLTTIMSLTSWKNYTIAYWKQKRIL